MKKKIGLTGIYFPGALETLRENVPEGFELIEALSEDKFSLLADCEYIINRLVLDDKIIKSAPKLKLLQRWGAGFDGVDLKSYGESGIPITTCPGVNSHIVAELAIMLMLALYRNLLPINRKILNNVWPKTEYFGKSFMIRGKTVGIIGLGNIGTKVAALVSAFGADVIYYDIKRNEELEKSNGYKYVTLEELLCASDIITLHVPLDESTRDMINDHEFSLMKKSVAIINTARGQVINEDALIKALEQNRIFGAGLDTYAHEPLTPGHKLVRFENVVASAHAGGNTKDNDINMVNYCYQNIINFDNGSPFNSERDLVNLQFLK